MNPLREPKPIWSEAPRYCPERTLPPYRFVPGLNPHPTGQESGHSYGQQDFKPPRVPPEQWRDNQVYLYGIDLYHQGFLWESHEAWESLWNLSKKRDVEGQFLQGLIQNAAAQLKLHIKNLEGALHLSMEAYRRLSTIADSEILDDSGRFMGLQMQDLMTAMTEHYQPLWENAERVQEPAPRLILA